MLFGNSFTPDQTTPPPPFFSVFALGVKDFVKRSTRLTYACGELKNKWKKKLTKCVFEKIIFANLTYCSAYFCYYSCIYAQLAKKQKKQPAKKYKD